MIAHMMPAYRRRCFEERHNGYAADYFQPSALRRLTARNGGAARNACHMCHMYDMYAIPGTRNQDVMACRLALLLLLKVHARHGSAALVFVVGRKGSRRSNAAAMAAGPATRSAWL